MWFIFFSWAWPSQSRSVCRGVFRLLLCLLGGQDRLSRLCPGHNYVLCSPKFKALLTWGNWDPGHSFQFLRKCMEVCFSVGIYTYINTCNIYVYIYIYICIYILSQFSHVWLFVTLWTVACQASQSWNSPGKNAGVGCHALLQGVFPTQALNLCLLHWRRVFFYCWATIHTSIHM